jgi:hypothetical protein
VWRSKNSLDYKGQVWWYTPVISDTWDVGIEKIMVQDQPA